MPGYFKPNKNFHSAMVRQTRRALKPRATAVKRRAFELAQFDTGDYRKSLKAERLKYGTGWRVSANVPYAKFLEFGTSRMKAYRTLGRALDAAKD